MEILLPLAASNLLCAPASTRCTCLQSLHSLTPAGLPPLPMVRYRVVLNLDLSNLWGKNPPPLQRCRALTVRNGDLSHKIDYVRLVQSSLNPKLHQNRSSGSKVMTISLKYMQKVYRVDNGRVPTPPNNSWRVSTPPTIQTCLPHRLRAMWLRHISTSC